MSFILQINNLRLTVSDIVNGQYPATLPDYAVDAILFCRAWLSGSQNFVQATSGSTGMPKSIVLSRVHMQISAKLSLRALQIVPKSPAILAISAYYIGGKMLLVRAMLNKSPVLLVQPSTNFLNQLPAKFKKKCWLSLVPLQIEKSLQAEATHDFLNNCSCILLGGAPVSTSLSKKLERLTSNVYSSYGMTETCSHIALKKLSGSDKTQNYQLLPGVKISLDSRQCLRIEGPMILGSLQTNDIVNVVNATEFTVLGRADNVINSGGIKIIPEKIEEIASNYLYSLNLPNNVLATYRSHTVLNQEVGLLIEAGHGFNAEIETGLLAYLASNLPKYWVPRFVKYVANISYLAAGKPDRIASLKVAELS